MRKVGRKLGARGTRLLLLAACASLSAVAWAAPQDDDFDGVSRPVVQALPGRGSMELNAALNRLARNPADVAALIDAGNAALLLGDVEAAMGFLARADQLLPGNARIKASLASAMVRGENPYDAIRLFEEAERAGASDAGFAGDRGLAHDLVGDNAGAQRFYRQALARGGSDEVARRLALSLAISGDRKASEAALLPQLQRQERAAWRTRAFALAILGDEGEAIQIVQGTMPRDMADGMIPYLRYMPRLTAAQQAAAANFGHFPRAAQIGRDDPRATRYAAASPRRTGRGADAGLIPEGEPFGRAGGKKEDKASRQVRRRPSAKSEPPAAVPRPRAVPGASAQDRANRTASLPPPVIRPPAPAPAAAAPPRTAELPPAVQTASAISAATPRPTTEIAVPAATVASPPEAIVLPPATTLPAAEARIAASSPASDSAQPTNFDLAVLAQQSSPAAAVPDAAATTAPAASRPGLLEAFSDFRPPAEEQQQSAAAAIDISRITPARPRPAVVDEGRGAPPEAPAASKRVASIEPAGAGKGAKAAPAKPAAPSHPSRIWVQVATGRDKAALGFDWRRMTRQSADLFKGRKAFTTPWGQANRLLTGPFESQAAAKAFLGELRKKDVDAFVWTSPAGQAVDSLPAA